ncbi:tetratricopeptide repeat protein [Caulobacter segnis]|uniref:tetratricopeptide repeat protein n=1 Tax=Caulobacter segnis TaxID=88688 RepID=UPI00240F2691|nr:tetratricopeptide repeat protein [Caulobacter segnis]MDG2523498.1 tetratricopeptide repeat protein [Caulobacter segnis]
MNAAAPAGSILDLQPVLTLAARLRDEHRWSDATTLFEHAVALRPDSEAALKGLAQTYNASGRSIEALTTLARLRAAHPTAENLSEIIARYAKPAIDRFNVHMNAGEVEQAEPFIAALALVVPANVEMIKAAMNCNQTLNRLDLVERYARHLLILDPECIPAHEAMAEVCRGRGDAAGDLEHRRRFALLERPHLHPLVRLKDVHDVASSILCGVLDPEREAELERMLVASDLHQVDDPEDTDWPGWARHYRLMLKSVDLDAVRAPTPDAGPEPSTELADSAGKSLDWKKVAARAERLGAQAVFLVAADEAYVDQYARLYARSVIKHCDVPFLVVVHVIGGAGRLEPVARKVGIDDERLIFAGDAFDETTVRTKVYDAPPKGLAKRPIGHFQSIRFLQAGAWLRRLQRPLFISDIDLLLQRGVSDLLEDNRGADLMFNENENSANAGARITANLVLAYPTPTTDAFFRFVSDYLARVLEREELTRWVDQVALMLGRHHLRARHPQAQLRYFDVTSDINNVMYRTWQENPFRFLSLYHGFDMSSLQLD